MMTPGELQSLTLAEGASNQGKRKLLLLVVLAIGFLLPTVFSLAMLFGWYRPTPPSEARMAARLLYQLAGFAALYLALRYQGQHLRDIGFFIDPTLLEIGRPLALFFAAYFLSVVYWRTVAFISPVFLVHRNYDPVAFFGREASVLVVLWLLLNPFHEELLVRAFLITEMEGIYRKTWLAVFFSVAVQTSYHLYQGIVPALSHVPVFTLFSVYYVRSRRVMPIILAHLILDLLYLAAYAKRYW